MSVSMTLKWLSPEQLIEEDASLSLGWLEIQTENNRYSLFEQKLCMLIITLCDLLEFLSSNEVNYDWVGVGGDTYALTRKESLIVIQKENIIIQIKYDVFVKSVIKATTNIIEHLSKINPAVKEEGAFIDLSNCLRKLIDKRA